MLNQKNKKITGSTIWLLSLTFFITCLAVFSPTTSLAQSLLDLDNSDSLALDINPRWPKPGQTVKIRLSGYGFSLEQSTVSWYVNKTQKQSAIGLREFSFQAPALGEAVNIAVVVKPQIGNRIIKQVNFVPATVDFLVEADSYTPTGYKGAALPGPYTKVKVVALANIKNGNSFVPPERINFSWEKDGQKQTNQSGVGKDYLIFYTKSHPSATSIKVTVKAINTGVTADNSTVISTVEPDIVLYPYLPLSGLKLEAITTKLDGSGETSIKAEPYYLDRQTVNSGGFLYNFIVNNKPVINKDSLGGLLNLIIDRNSNEAKIDLTISNISDRLQQYQKSFALPISSNAFGQ